MKLPVYNMGLNYDVFFKENLTIDPSNPLIQSFLKRFNKIIHKENIKLTTGSIYGASSSGLFVYNIIQNILNIKISNFIDCKLHGTVGAIPILHPKEAEWGEFVIICVSPHNYFSVFQIIKHFLSKTIYLFLLWDYPFLSQKGNLFLDLDSVTPLYAQWSQVLQRNAIHQNIDIWEYYTTIDTAGKKFINKAEYIYKTFLFPLIKKNDHIVEIGPGTGIFSRMIRKELVNGKIHLFEKDEWWRDYLAKNVFYDDSNVIIHNCDGVSLHEIPSESIDIVFACTVFTFIQPYMLIFTYLKEASRVLKKGGSLFFDFFNSDNTEECVPFIENSIKEQALDGNPLISSKIIQEFLKKHNMELKECRQNENKGVRYYATFCKLI
ncbi:MAG: class I SAM-dependent methyltransferase [Desulfobacterales bacterium]|nr:class I SAM-dependent methyltransferase [Desulfobacterales bacterium]